jgi:hypothetical protein
LVQVGEGRIAAAGIMPATKSIIHDIPTGSQARFVNHLQSAKGSLGVHAKDPVAN